MGVINPPNEGEFKDNRKANGFLPLTGSKTPVDPPNLSRYLHGDPGGSADLAHQASPMEPLNATKFRAGDVGRTADERAPVAIEPGKPAVPVNPFVKSSGLLGPVPASILRSK